MQRLRLEAWVAAGKLCSPRLCCPPLPLQLRVHPPGELIPPAAIASLELLWSCTSQNPSACACLAAETGSQPPRRQRQQRHLTREMTLRIAVHLRQAVQLMHCCPPEPLPLPLQER